MFIFLGVNIKILETKRLRICEITKKDSKNLVKVLSDPEVMKYSTVGVHSKKQISEYIVNCKKQYTLNNYGPWAIYKSDSNEFIGICGINKHIIASDEIIHINYRICSEQQGKGYANESIIGVLSFIKNILNFKCINAIVEPENIPSVNLAKKTGFKFVNSSLFRGINFDIYQMIL